MSQIRLASESQTQDAESTGQNPDRPRTAAKGLRAIMYLAMLILFLPTLLTVTGRTAAVLSWTHPQLEKLVTWDSMSLHWWSPIQIRGLRLQAVPDHDSASVAATGIPADREITPPLFAAAQVQTAQPLWRLVFNLGHGTRINVAQPQLNLLVRDGRTNLEDTLEQVFEKQSSPTRLPALSIHWESGQLSIQSAHDPAAVTTLTDLAGHYAISGNAADLPDVELIASMKSATADPVGYSAERLSRRLQQDTVHPRIAATLDELAGDFPLRPFDETPQQIVEADRPPAVRVRLQPGQAEQPGWVVVEAHQLALQDLQPLIQRLWPGSTCSGVTSCRLQMRLLGTSLAEGIAGRLQLAGRDVRWHDQSWADGEFLTLDHCSLTGAAAVADDGILLNGLELNSSVAQLSGSGEVLITSVDPLLKVMRTAGQPDSGGFSAAVSEAEAVSAGQLVVEGHLDIAELMSMLPRTLHLKPNLTLQQGGVRFAARLNRAAESIAASGTAAADPVRWQVAVETTAIQALHDGRVLDWKSPFRGDAAGSLSASAWSLKQARLAGRFGDLNVNPAGDEMQISGTLNPHRLWQDLSQLLELPEPGIVSDVQIQAALARGADFWRFADVALESRDLSILCPELTVASDRSLMERFAGSVQLQGRGAAVQTLLAPWLGSGWLAESSSVTARLAAEPGQLLQLQVHVQPGQSRFREASVYRTISAGAARSTGLTVDEATVDLQLLVTEDGQQFQIRSGQIQLPGLTSSVSGIVSSPAGILHTDLIVDASYDLDLLSRRLLHESPVQLSGQGRDQFRIQGSPQCLTAGDVSRLQRITSDSAKVIPLTATGSVSWTGGSVYGLTLGPATAVVSLDNGMVRAEPIHCAVNSGEVHVLPLYDLTSGQLQLATGSRFENVELTRELTREWIGYIAPLLSDATQVAGRCSGRIHRFQYNFQHPAQSVIQGLVTIHEAAVTPGDSLTTLLQVLQLLQPGRSLIQDLTMPAQDIAVDLQNGLIVHDQAIFELAGYQLVTRGGVALDQRIRLTLEVPLERRRDQPLSATRTVAVPVTGTLGRPELDTSRLMQGLSTDRLQQELNQQLDNQLNQLLEKLR